MREICYKCKWRRRIGGGTDNGKACLVSDSGRPNLFRVENRVYDRRGPDKNKCLMQKNPKVYDGDQMDDDSYSDTVLRALEAYGVVKVTRCIECGHLIKYKTKIPYRCEKCRKGIDETY